MPRSRVGTRMVVALANRVQAPCEVFGPDLKVETIGRIRYPDATVVCVPAEAGSDLVQPTVVCDVVSPTTALTDRRVKAAEYAAVPHILVCVLLEQDRPEIAVLRRSQDRRAEVLLGPDAMLALPEVGVSVKLSEIYRV